MKIDDLVQSYIKIRDKKAQLKAEYEAKLGPFNEAQERIEAVLLHQFSEMGVDSVKTPEGTAYAAVRSSASVADWDAFKAFCAERTDPFELIERRVSKTAVEEYRNETKDLPPGVNWSETRVVNFRRPS